MPKATDEDKQRFRELIEPLAATFPTVEVKAMFGQLGAFVNGNMFAGLFGSDVGVKLQETDAGRLAESGGGPFGPEERPMNGYLSIPVNGNAPDWVAKAAAFVSTLPPKASKKK